MGRAEVRAEFSGALSAIVVIALIVATTAVMLVTLNTKAGAMAELGPGLTVTGTVVAVAPPADRR